ncbi:MAG: hypothetical protein A2X61_10245 [Ignavibacteria bacterium GWB2_35_12]|nr:MAG: hypothetical protein A2X63_08355 [Ignavibacteria bacterium GWA2_35_8]OGU39744.1 MAG: hypothetical protein A2X61_10245 [Ignavibacteria bacterium GWB2_35_12]OGU91230.1 MAG: hypothetical protein A2220_16500 [Ignavibacteria bacterium RIFOXYA2_FULL_35_10]OGV21365.1 MAG: hypothetical protein A2475_15035 [Ignavibacteria bacterium RIFOXYC2_FULL_35_21]
MKIEIIHSKETLKFIEKHSNLLDRSHLDGLVIKAVRKITKIENNNIDIKKIKRQQQELFQN